MTPEDKNKLDRMLKPTCLADYQLCITLPRDEAIKLLNTLTAKEIADAAKRQN